MILGQNGGFQTVLFVGSKESSFETKFSDKSITLKRVGGNIYVALGQGKEKWVF